MKSLNDIIWNEDIDLEDGNNIEIQSKMREMCLKLSCGGNPPPLSKAPKVHC